MMAKLLGRKHLMALTGAILVVVNKKFNLGLSNEELWQIIGAFSAFIIGESIVDAKRVQFVEDEAPKAEETPKE